MTREPAREAFEIEAIARERVVGEPELGPCALEECIDQRAIIGGSLGEGAAISTAMIPFLLAAILVSWFGLQRRKWQQGGDND